MGKIYKYEKTWGQFKILETWNLSYFGNFKKPGKKCNFKKVWKAPNPHWTCGPLLFFFFFLFSFLFPPSFSSLALLCSFFLFFFSALTDQSPPVASLVHVPAKHTQRTSKPLGVARHSLNRRHGGSSCMHGGRLFFPKFKCRFHRWFLVPNCSFFAIRSEPKVALFWGNDPEFVLVMKNTFQWYISFHFLVPFSKNHIFWVKL